MPLPTTSQIFFYLTNAPNTPHTSQFYEIILRSKRINIIKTLNDAPSCSRKTSKFLKGKEFAGSYLPLCKWTVSYTILKVI